MAYFFVALANRENLELCIRHGIAGFTDSVMGVWAFNDIDIGDYVSFVFAARAHNLYRVEAKYATKDHTYPPPWKPVRFQSGKEYHFPFRLQLQPVREFDEPLVRAEFAYVAENLLLRGGYRRTHFQADQTTLQQVSHMGKLASPIAERIDQSLAPGYEPLFTLNRERQAIPWVFYIQEPILQALVRKWLETENGQTLALTVVGCRVKGSNSYEVLGEKALPEGHIDILLKERVPIAETTQILVEVKTQVVQEGDLNQVLRYRSIIGKECIGVALVARQFPSRLIRRAKAERVGCLAYNLGSVLSIPDGVPFDTLRAALQIEPVV